jgi:glycosyltransferase involved in cell wall biosynthesis
VKRLPDRNSGGTRLADDGNDPRFRSQQHVPKLRSPLSVRTSARDRPNLPGSLQTALRILQVSAVDNAGGAAKVASKLFEGYGARGHQSWMAVGVKRSSKANIFAIPHAPAARGWGRLWWSLHDRVRTYSGRASRATALIASPQKIVDDFRGVENFDFPGTRRLLGLAPEAPDVVHLHNLHGFFGYFDLRALQPLSRAIPTVVTLHDSWLFTGHCAISFDCNKWESGCGSCPYLDTYPSVRRDSTDLNWLRKKQIYENSSLFVAAPSHWLLERAKGSILSHGIVGSKLIPNGVDLSIFRPAEKAAARERIGLPQDERILLFSGFSPANSPFKDLPTLRAAAEMLGRVGADITLVVLGANEETQRIGRATIRFAGYETDEAKVARFYQATDVYVHAARVGAENHSLAILEALACGAPVVASDVGGIPEQVKSLRPPSSGSSHPSHPDGATGILTPPGDAKALADAVTILMEDSALLRVMSTNAAKDARHRFDLQTQVDAYLDWYTEIIERRLRGSMA